LLARRWRSWTIAAAAVAAITISVSAESAIPVDSPLISSTSHSLSAHNSAPYKEETKISEGQLRSNIVIGQLIPFKRETARFISDLLYMTK
jgi:hypothetical protein